MESILDNSRIKSTIIDEVRPFLTEDIIKARSEVSYKHGWNDFFVLGFLKIKKLRYLIIKYLLAGLVQSNGVEDFVKTARELIVEGIRGFLMEDTGNDLDYEHLKVEETLFRP